MSCPTAVERKKIALCKASVSGKATSPKRPKTGALGESAGSKRSKLAACGTSDPVLDSAILVRRQPKAAGLADRAKAAVAVLLTLLVILAASISASDTLHSSLHANGSLNHHFCLACAFAAGQVSAVETALALPALLLCLLGLLHLAHSALLPAFDYRLAPSRAPPRL